MIVNLKASGGKAVRRPKVSGAKVDARKGIVRKGTVRKVIAGRVIVGQAGAVRTVPGKAAGESGANAGTTGAAAIAAASKVRPKSTSKN